MVKLAELIAIVVDWLCRIGNFSLRDFARILDIWFSATSARSSASSNWYCNWRYFVKFVVPTCSLKFIYLLFLNLQIRLIVVYKFWFYFVIFQSVQTFDYLIFYLLPPKIFFSVNSKNYYFKKNFLIKPLISNSSQNFTYYYFW